MRSVARSRIARAIAALAVAAAVLTGCDDDERGDAGGIPTAETPPADTAFARAVSQVASGTIPIGTGYGFIDVDRLRTTSSRRGFGRDLDRAAPALGPGGDDVLLAREEVHRQTGIDLARASALTASAASFTLGFRVEGVERSRLRPAFVDGGRAAGSRDGWVLRDFGPVSSIPYGTPAEAFGPFGPRVAIARDAVVGARRDQSRTDLIGIGSDPLDDPAAALAVACLGDVVAARVVPNNFTHWPNSGPELLAFGFRPAGAGPPDEVLCAADPSSERATDAAEAMTEAFAADSEDTVILKPIADEVASADVQLLHGDGAAAARAELELADGERPGFLFGAFVRGSIATYVGLRPPEPVG